MKKKTNLKLYFSIILLFQLTAWFYSSQKIAEILNYQDGLFGKIECIKGIIYWPWSWIGWQMVYGTSESKWIFDRYGWNLSLLMLMISVLVSVSLIIRNHKENSITHGSAHFATREEIEDFGYDKSKNGFWEIFRIFG